MKQIFISVLIVLAFLGTGCKAPQSKSAAAEKTTQVAATDSVAIYDNQYLVEVGDVAPDFEMSLPSGEKVKLSSLRGKIVMLQFTASWCGVCRKEMPFIEKDIWQKHKDNPKFALYGIDRDEPADTVKMFAEKTGVTYPIGLDPNADIFGLYALKEAGITRNVIIDENGKIVKLTRLFDKKEFDEMVMLLDSLLTNLSK